MLTKEFLDQETGVFDYTYKDLYGVVADITPKREITKEFPISVKEEFEVERFDKMCVEIRAHMRAAALDVLSKRYL